MHTVMLHNQDCHVSNHDDFKRWFEGFSFSASDIHFQPYAGPIYRAGRVFQAIVTNTPEKQELMSYPHNESMYSRVNARKYSHIDL